MIDVGTGLAKDITPEGIPYKVKTNYINEKVKSKNDPSTWESKTLDEEYWLFINPDKLTNDLVKEIEQKRSYEGPDFQNIRMTSPLENITEGSISNPQNETIAYQESQLITSSPSKHNILEYAPLSIVTGIAILGLAYATSRLFRKSG
jgi:hypothetical protein